MTPEQETGGGAPGARPAPAPQNNLGIPIAIVIASLVIGGAVYLSGNKSAKPGVNVDEAIKAAENGQVTGETVVAPVTKDDHIRGNPNAPIMIIEYSDFDCPFCRLFHDTMKRVSDEYGPDGKVAWVFRHFPIAQLHPTAPKIHSAALCVAELGGNDAFWKFADALNDSREIVYDENGNIKSIPPTNMVRIPEFATAAGVDKGKFELCYNSDKYTETIKASVEAAAKAGANGTPHSIILVGDEQIPINGAQPYEYIRQILDNLLEQINR